MTRRVLVIGGSYFVGRVFVETLHSTADWEVFVLNRGRAPLLMEGVHEIVCDRHSPELVEAIPGLDFEAVVDFCAYEPQDVGELMTALPRGRVRQYILISTASVYQPTRRLPVTEEAPKLDGPQPELGPAANYGFDKWRTEQRLAALCREAGLPVTVFRPTIIYGPYNYAPRESYFFDLIEKNATIYLPENDLALFHFVLVSDVAHALLASIGCEAAYDQVFNLAAEDLVSYRRLVDVLEEVVGRRLPVKTLPPSEIDRRRLPLPFPLDSHLIYSGERIKSALHFAYTPFAEGMKQTYAWHQARIRGPADRG
jgi:nucleoside-diphosphate-sugar epimerase